MALGPGKYDALATYVREQSKAEAVVVIILNGERGAGFSVQGSPEATLVLSDLLDYVSAQIRKDLSEIDP